MIHVRPVCALLALGVAAVFAGAVLAAESQGAKGPYTADQAKSGLAAYKNSCAQCHGPALQGAGDGPGLAGRDFMSRWSTGSIRELFNLIKYTMPQSSPGSLSDETYANIVAYILQVNGSPAGAQPLAASLEMSLNAAIAGGGSAATSQASASSHNVTQADLARWRKELSNWGRWGGNDEIGTMNLITPEKRKQAAALVKEGITVSLAADADTQKAVDNPRPYEHEMLGIGSDRIGVTHHGWAHTHLDSLAHHHDDGVFYNGYKPNEADVLKSGHAKNSIHNLKNGVFTRGILIDIPLLKGVPYLEPGTPVYVEDLEAFEKMAGIKVSPGDVLLIRTGVWAYRTKFGPFERGRGGRVAGPHASVLPWLKERGVSILGTDGQSQVAPSDLPGAVHDFSMSVLGIHVLDNADLEAVSAAAAARKRWEFLFSAAPLPIKGGTGSPINPIATF